MNNEAQAAGGPAREWIIETRSLTRTYGSGDLRVLALSDVNLRIAPGEFVAIVGPSGSGKSTLLHMLGALDQPTAGKVFVAGQDLSTVRDLDRFRSQTVGFVFQLHNLIPTLTALENVMVPMMGLRKRKARQEQARYLLGQVGLESRAGHLPGALSGGERQRVAVARALANEPSLVLADEPTGNLDSTSGGELILLLREINTNLGTTFVVVTHDPSVARQTDRVLVVRDGGIVREDIIGSPLEEDLKSWRRSRLGEQILGDPDSLKELFADEEERQAVARLLERTERFADAGNKS